MATSFLAQHAPDATVAFGAAGTRSARQLCADAARIAAQLPEPEPDAQLLLIFRDDRYAFVASLWAALARGHRVALPHDTGRDTVLALAQRQDTQLVLHDTPSGAPLRVDRLLAETASSPPPPDLPPVAPAAALRLFASDGRGDYIGHDTTWGALLSEASDLAAALDLPCRARVLSDVTPGHPFGLALGVLAPLVRGGAVLRESLSEPTALREALGAHADALWVTVPHTLTRHEATLPALADGLRRVVIGAGWVASETLAAATERLRAPATQVVGSAATGSLLVRAHPGAPFHLLPGVHADVDDQGCLHVSQSARAHAPAASVKTGHVVRRTPQGLDYLGDVDDFVTSQAERWCLSELVASVRRLPGVRDAALCVPESGPLAGKLLVAWVGEARASADPLADALRDVLPASLPVARVLHTDLVPRDALGNVDRGALLWRFGLLPDGQPLSLTLSWGRQESSLVEGVHRAHFAVRVPEDYAYFDGHFPGYPILPGAAQLGELVIPCLRRARPELGELRQLTRLKFLGRIVPGAEVDVQLSWSADERAVDFSLCSDGSTKAAGRLSFEAESAP